MASTGAAAVTGDAKNVWQTKCDSRDEFNCIQLCVGLGGGSARVVTVSRYKLIFPLQVPAGHRSPDSYHRSNPSQAELLFHCWASLSACPQLSLARLNGRAPPSTRLSTFSVIGNICPSPSHISAEEFLISLASSVATLIRSFPVLISIWILPFSSIFCPGVGHRRRFPIRQKRSWVNFSFRFLISQHLSCGVGCQWCPR